MNIILMGMPASGKTTVAGILCKALGAELVDTDALVVEKHGEINKIFEKFGEERFRDLESAAVEYASNKQDAVISTGGGCVLRKENVERLQKSGKIIFLRTSLNELLKRTEGDGARPLLKGEREERLKSLLAARTPLYESAADFTVDTDGLTPKGIVNKITEFLK
ncbi:MAG: shikimate kinase [Clostridia bacterium]|nr:shikimate kinase [Clostridia bacterium]